MAKSHPHAEHYQFITASRDADGILRWEYRLYSGETQFMTHDEDTSDWSEADVIRMTRDFLCVDKDDPVKIKFQEV